MKEGRKEGHVWQRLASVPCLSQLLSLNCLFCIPIKVSRSESAQTAHFRIYRRSNNKKYWQWRRVVSLKTRTRSVCLRPWQMHIVWQVRAASDGDGSEIWLPMYPDALGILTFFFCFVVSLFIVCKALGDLRISIRFSSRNFPNTSLWFMPQFLDVVLLVVPQWETVGVC